MKLGESIDIGREQKALNTAYADNQLGKGEPQAAPLIVFATRTWAEMVEECVEVQTEHQVSVEGGEEVEPRSREPLLPEETPSTTQSIHGMHMDL